MFKWLKIWKKDDHHYDHFLNDIKSQLQNDANLCNKELHISEPVTSFIKCFKENPRRFKLVRVGRVSYHASTHYTFTDKKTNEKWNIAYRPLHNGKMPHIDGVTWMTEDERELIAMVFVTHYAEREIRLHEIRLARHTAKMNKERDRLTKIYKGD